MEKTKDVACRRTPYIFHLSAVALLAFLLALLAGPLREVYVDIRLDPPKEVGRTDFSWLSVNEWFNTQAHDITSYILLEKIRVGVPYEKLTRMISARRVNGTYAIRLSARSNYSFSALSKVITEVSESYLAQLSTCELGLTRVASVLRGEKERLTGALDSTDSSLNRLELKVKDLAPRPSKKEALNSQIAEIEVNIIQLKVELSGLRAVYTDSWPQIQEIMRSIDSFEDRKKRLGSELLSAQKDEEARRVEREGAEAAISKLRQVSKELKDKLKKVEGDLAQAQNSRLPEEKCARGFISGPPVKVFLPGLRARLSAALLAALLIWLVAFYVVRRTVKN